MLILVGVTINLAANGGLFEKSRTAKTETQREVDRENLLAALISGYKEDGNFEIAKVELPERVKWIKSKEDLTVIETPNLTGNWVITENKNKFFIDKYGNILDDEPTNSVSFYYNEPYLKIDGFEDGKPIKDAGILILEKNDGQITIKSWDYNFFTEQWEPAKDYDGEYKISKKDPFLEIIKNTLEPSKDIDNVIEDVILEDGELLMCFYNNGEIAMEYREKDGGFFTDYKLDPDFDTSVLP